MHLKGRYFFTMYVIIICDGHVNNAQKNGKIKYHYKRQSQRNMMISTMKYAIPTIYRTIPTINRMVLIQINLIFFTILTRII